jgi:hypothetical protein
MTREQAHKECLSRDCRCVAGKDRDSNYHEVIDKIFDHFEYVIEGKQMTEKLFSKVLKKDIRSIEITGNTMHYTYSLSPDLIQASTESGSINVYELAFKCKEWAESNGYVLESSTFNLEGFCSIKWIGSGRLKSIPWEPQPSSTEYEAIFRACQWILDNK